MRYKLRAHSLLAISLTFIMILSNIQIFPFHINITEEVHATTIRSQTNWSAPFHYFSKEHIEITNSTEDVILFSGNGILVADLFNHRIVMANMNSTIWFEYGSQGPGIGQFDRPYGICYDNKTGDIYIADTFNHRIIKTKIDGTGWTTFGTLGSGIGQFSGPRSIDFDSETGYIYITDSGNHRIVKTMMTGSGWSTLGTGSYGNGTGEFYMPMDLFYDNSSDNIYVADTSNHRIIKTKIDGSDWLTFGKQGNKTGQFYNPYNIEFDNTTGFIYITDNNNHRLVKTKMNGSGWTTYGSYGLTTQKGEFHFPRGLHFDKKNDHLYVTDNIPGIVRTTMNGSSWSTYGAFGSGKGAFNTPIGITQCNSNYCPNGYLVSSEFNCGGYSNLLKLSWNSNTPTNTSIKFQLRSGKNKTVLYSNKFVGPNGNVNDYYTISGSNVWSGHDGDKWMQYKVYLETKNYSITPILKDVFIEYNLLPNSPIIITPINNTMTNDNTPLFVWQHNDSDSTSQFGYHWQLDDKRTFSSVDQDVRILTSSQNSFTPTTPIPDGVWYWRIKTKDSDNGWGFFSKTKTVLIDTKSPESIITKPQNNCFYKRLTTIKGTAVDPEICSGVNYTSISIKRLDDNKYWNGIDWSDEQYWLTTTGFEDWRYDASSVIWGSGLKYFIQSITFDNATNQEIIGSGVVFKYDTDPPISLVEIPVNNSAYNNLDIISGKTYDVGGCGVKEVKIMVKAQENNKCWNGKKWTDTETWLTATGNSTWSYDSRGVLWENGERYKITARAIDKLDNIEIIPKSNTFIFDIIRPYSIVQYPGENTYLNRVETISGNSTDTGGSGIANVEISIKDRSSNQYWNGNRWQEKEFWLTTNGADNWTYNASSISWTSDVYYQIYSKAIDKAGNYMVSEPGNTFMYDSKPPKVSFFINDNAEYTNSTSITLTLDASDTGSGVSQISFSFDGVQWSSWEQYSNGKVLDLPSDDGEKTVYLRGSDKANNTASPISKKIILDTDPPIGLIIVNNDNKFTNSKDIIITLTGSDILSGVKDMSFSTDNLTWSPWEPFSKTGSYTLSGSDGEKMVYFRLRDQAGNIGITSDMIILDTTPPSMLEVIINDGALLTERTEVTLKLTASDQLSGVDKMSFCTLDQNWSSWEDFSDVRSYNLTTGNGEKQIFYRVKDKAGNIAVPASARITLVLPTPETQKQKPDDTNWFLLILIIIIIIVILLISIKMYVNKKKRNKSISSEGQDLNQDQPENSSSNFSKNGDIEESLIATNEPEQLSTIPILPELGSTIKELPQLPPVQKEKQKRMKL